jgi:hypothetical protein
VARIIISNDSSSLGLSPAVYFYSWTGKQQPILFLTIARIVIGLEQRKWFNSFTKCRKEFEEFLINHRTLLNQVIRKFGTKSSGETHLSSFYIDILQHIRDSGRADTVVAALTKDRKYSYLQPDELPYDGVVPTRYSTSVKSGLVIQELLGSAIKCPICGGVVPTQSISLDHKIRKEDGGQSTSDNAQVTHPYCNTGFKEWLSAKHGRET